jgi:mycofactocin precursor
MADNPAPDLADEAPAVQDGDELAEDVLVEEVSIDGMCGVY